MILRMVSYVCDVDKAVNSRCESGEKPHTEVNTTFCILNHIHAQ